LPGIGSGPPSTIDGAGAIVAGRSLWDLFAHEISAVPAPSVPVLAVALIVVGALVLANLVAFVPGVLPRRRRPQ
jgi:hypothetical protein